MPVAEPYLKLGGVEVMNGLRTLTYLRRGLGGGAFDIHVRQPLEPERGYSDTYDDRYYADPFWPGNLVGYCSVIDGGPYVSPTVDPAPWYDPARPESADFLGLLANVAISEVIGRTIEPRSSGGGTLGTRILKPRVLAVTGNIYAASPAGMEWGQRWLAQALAGEALGCVSTEAELLPACPPDDAFDPPTALRRLEQVGLIDVPTYGPIGTAPECIVQTIGFQLAAGVPHLRAPEQEVIARTPLRTLPSMCGVMDGPDLIGDTAARIKVHAGGPGNPLDDVTITATWDPSGSCPSALAPTITYPVTAVPVGTVLTIDASLNEVTLTDMVTGNVVGGRATIDIDGIFPWVVAAPGERVCICVTAAGHINAGSLIEIDAVPREL